MNWIEVKNYFGAAANWSTNKTIKQAKRYFNQLGPVVVVYTLGLTKLLIKEFEQ